ncbi:alpha/beta hydrolases superfamily protein, partial [Tanacetum coccineum]
MRHGGSDGLHAYVHSLDDAVTDAAALDPKIEKSIAGVVATSPAVGVQPSHPIFLILAPVLSLLLPKFQLSAANKKGTPVSRDPAALIAKYSDPLVYTGSIRVRTGHEILRITSFLQRNTRNLKVPFFVLHVTADTVTDPDATFKLYQEAPSEDKSIKLLPGYLHDLLFEPEREEIKRDIIDWLNSRVGFGILAWKQPSSKRQHSAVLKPQLLFPAYRSISAPDTPLCLLLTRLDEEAENVASQSKKTDKRVKRFRNKSENQDDDDAHLRQEKQAKHKASQDETDESESEEERLRDQQEREELERHLREKDASRTANLKLSKREEEEAIRRAKALKEDQGGFGTLRKVSRQEYLKKREQKKLEEIRDDIQDEHCLFNDVKLTQVEERELRYKKQIYELVKKRTQEEEDDNLNEYRLPDAYDDEYAPNQEKRFAV